MERWKYEWPLQATLDRFKAANGNVDDLRGLSAAIADLIEEFERRYPGVLQLDDYTVFGLREDYPADVDEFDSKLSDIYDACDDARVWCLGDNHVPRALREFAASGYVPTLTIPPARRANNR